ncbi:MAG TPA: hypothetical protein VFF06_23410 [Polyangia bacterium]|nr:hypothetical protein [Polyangia bacterium]
MADSAGALLLRSGIVRPEQVAEAQRLRQHDGGSFGECLVRIGAIDEEKLVDFYHKRLMIPRLDENKLKRKIAPAILHLVQREMAAEFRVIPVDIDPDGAVVLAMADPSDNHAVDEVTFFADRFVVRAVASESSVRDAIETHYGVRFTSPARAGAKPPPTPAARPTVEQLEEQIVLLTKVKRSEETPLPIPIPPPDDYKPQYAPDEPILLTRPKERERRDTLPGLTAPVPDPPLTQLRKLERRDEIGSVILDYVAQLTKRVILFVIQRELLVGREARGEDVNMLSELGIDIAAASIFRDVISSRLPYRGPLPETPVNRAFAQALGGVGAEVLLMPILVRERVIAVLFADQALQPLPDAALHATTREAGLAYERLILGAKTVR